MTAALRAKGKNANGAIDPNAPVTPDPNAPAAAAAPGAEEDGDEPAAAAATQPKPGEGIDKKKVNPWKLIDEYKAKLADKEKEASDIRKLFGDPQARQKEVERLAEIQKRNEELEKTIHFVDYSKSKEFVEKYQKPYEEKWSQTMSEIRDMSIMDPESGSERAVAPQDMLQLMNMPLNKATDLAKELYGDAYPVMMQYRQELRNLFNAKSSALEKAKTEGVETKKREMEANSKTQQELSEFANSHWEVANKGITENEKTGQYFRPIEGQDDLNQKLETGYKFVDEVMAMNPFDPKLTKEDRAKIIEKHAAVRARAAGFGRLRVQYEQSQSEIADLKAKLAQYEGSVPNAGGTEPAAGDMSGRSTANSSVFSALRKLAK